jgi:hypothetical protein
MRVVAMAWLFFSCAASQHAPVRWGTVRVGFVERGFRGEQLSAMRDELRAMEALGPSFAETSVASADVVVVSIDDGACERSVDGAGWYDSASRTISINLACVDGAESLRAVLGHELGHSLGMGHVCRPQERGSDCSPVGFGYALMNPSTSRGDALSDGPPFAVPTTEPAPLDLAEFRRTHP